MIAMSGGTIRRYTNKLIAEQKFSLRTQTLINSVLDSMSLTFFQFLYDASMEAGLTEEQMAVRSAAIVLEHAAVHLSDDLSDNECEYLKKPRTDGPALVMLLQNLSHYSLQFANISQGAMKAALSLLSKTGNGQLEELHIRKWHYSQTIEYAKILNGFQLEAYLTLLWDSSALIEKISDTASYFGTVMHLAVDIQQHDKRIFSLSEQEQKQIQTEASILIKKLEEKNISCINNALIFAKIEISKLG
jgi:hypothetical protein